MSFLRALGGNLGVTLDPTLTFKTQIWEVTKMACFTWIHQHTVAKIRPFLSFRNAEIVLHAPVSSRLDYCDCLFSGLPNCTTRSLPLVPNSAES